MTMAPAATTLPPRLSTLQVNNVPPALSPPATTTPTARIVRTLSATTEPASGVSERTTAASARPQRIGIPRLPGATSVIDLVGFLQALDRIGYDGPVAVEPFDASLVALPPGERVRLVAESPDEAFDAAQIAPATGS